MSAPAPAAFSRGDSYSGRPVSEEEVINKYIEWRKAQAEAPSDASGFLYKKAGGGAGDNTSPPGGSWSRRWFKLESGRLSYGEKQAAEGAGLDDESEAGPAEWSGDLRHAKVRAAQPSPPATVPRCWPRLPTGLHLHGKSQPVAAHGPRPRLRCLPRPPRRGSCGAKSGRTPARRNTSSRPSPPPSCPRARYPAYTVQLPRQGMGTPARWLSLLTLYDAGQVHFADRVLCVGTDPRESADAAGDLNNWRLALYHHHAHATQHPATGAAPEAVLEQSYEVQATVAKMTPAGIKSGTRVKLVLDKQIELVRDAAQDRSSGEKKVSL